jgi:hypothetical protein
MASSSAQAQQLKDDNAERETRARLHAIIGEQVMHLLGQPGGQTQVKVHRLWEDTYRVNVFTTSDDHATIVSHSYFLVTDGEGNIVTATPRIVKQY